MTLKYQAEAIILLVRDIGSADRMLTLFSREYGKMAAVVYGARRSKKRQSGSLQPFAHLDISLAKSRGIDIAEQWETKTSFQKLREDLSMMAYASLLSELVNELWPEKEAEPQLFDLILEAFHLISSRNPRITALAGSFKLISLAGFHPDYDTCIHCGESIAADAYFDYLAGGAVCRSCRDVELPQTGAQFTDLTESMRRFIFMLESIFLKAAAPPDFSVNTQTLSQTECLIFNYINHHLDLGRELRSLSFIRKINALAAK